MPFLPREEQFFQYFDQQVDIIVEAVSVLTHAVKAGPSAFATSASKIEELEHKGDVIVHEVVRKLGSTFITPIDPEDIHRISSLLDTVLDDVEDVAHRLVAYRVEDVTPEILYMTDLLAKCVAALKRAMLSLEKRQAILEHCIEINRLEEEADVVERKAIGGLFQNEKDPIRLLKYKEIYELLEHATDSCEDVADQLQSVVVKNS